VGTERLFGAPTLSHLRVLHLTHSEHYPLDVLAGNPALANLTHLTLHALAPDRDEGRLYLGLEQLRALAYSPYLTSLTHLRFQRSDIGDEGVRLLIESGLLRRLRLLDLSLGTITDTGATLLAQAETSGIEHLNLTDNAISPEGLRRLGQALGNRLALSIDNQHPPEDEDWLYWGEME
jgi:Ran GTPase-activating protein (RanGAP) involved in mRNA processing and transport